MTLDKYYELKQKLSFIETKIHYNFGKLESRWYDRKINTDDVTHKEDLENLKNISDAYGELQKIVKQYIE